MSVFSSREHGVRTSDTLLWSPATKAFDLLRSAPNKRRRTLLTGEDVVPPKLADTSVDLADSAMSTTTEQPLTPTNGVRTDDDSPGLSANGNSQQQGHPSFRRQRASRACETCHARKVRCDAASLGVPCTNCVAFSIECKIPAPKRKKVPGKPNEEIEHDTPTEEHRSPNGVEPSQPHLSPTLITSQEGLPVTRLSEQQQAEQNQHSNTYASFFDSVKPRIARAPIKEAGRVAYLGESSNLSILVHDRYGSTDVVHYPLPDTVRGASARLTELDNLEIDILHQRGAFLLPPRELCDELVECYFKWIAPIVPVINRSRFMKRYRDPRNPPSLLLLQAILLAGSRVCTNPQLMDPNGSTTPAAMTFYKRAKALYDANYEDDRVTIVQSLILMGWYWEGPEDVTKNVFYWSRVATIVAQGSGMHRSVEGSQLSRADKRLWKRIWWTLFTRDRSVAVALGRPIHINTDDSDVEMIDENDFIEDDNDGPAEYPANKLHVQFFLQYVKLCEIMGLVLSQQYSVAHKSRRHNQIDLAQSDLALADWLQNCPKEVCWNKDRHEFWSALLHSNYYTTLCLLHRAHMGPNLGMPNGSKDDPQYPSKNIAFVAAGMVTSIMDNLTRHEQLRFCPGFSVYSLFSALIMHVYQMRSTNQQVLDETKAKVKICMGALKEISKVWLVAKMVHTLFESILGNKTLEERLQKASGKRHKYAKMMPKQEDPPKRKFDEMDFNSYPSGPPAPQVSYERSRPQSPAIPTREPAQNQLGMSRQFPMSSPQVRSNEPLMSSASRGNTRPTTPFNQGFNFAPAQNDIFLVTRSSPPDFQNLWENFQPNNLFPEGASLDAFQHFSPPQIDPSLTPQNSLAAVSMAAPPSLGHPSTSGPANSPPVNQMMSRPQNNLNLPPGQWPNQFEAIDGSSPDDTWSNSSKGAVVPTTLNVEDWFQFFGLNGGELHGVNANGL